MYLINKGNISDVDVQLYNDPLILLLLQQVLALIRIAVKLLLNSSCDGSDKVKRIQVQIVAENFSKLFRRQQRLGLVPGEGVAQLLTFDVHVKADGNQLLGQGGVLVDRRGVSVVEAQWEGSHFFVHNSVAIDWGGLEERGHEN